MAALGMWKYAEYEMLRQGAKELKPAWLLKVVDLARLVNIPASRSLH